MVGVIKMKGSSPLTCHCAFWKHGTIRKQGHTLRTPLERRPHFTLEMWAPRFRHQCGYIPCDVCTVAIVHLVIHRYSCGYPLRPVLHLEDQAQDYVENRRIFLASYFTSKINSPQKVWMQDLPIVEGLNCLLWSSWNKLWHLHIIHTTSKGEISVEMNEPTMRD